MDCIYVKVHAVVHGKHVILSISQKQVHVSTMTKTMNHDCVEGSYNALIILFKTRLKTICTVRTI